MYQRLKFQSLENTFVVSDCHFRHDKDFIWATRGFQSCEEHNETLIQEWNNRVKEDSVVFHLGDFMFKDPEGTYTLDFLDKLNFSTLYLLGGNHHSGVKAVYTKTLESKFSRGEYEICSLLLDLEEDHDGEGLGLREDNNLKEEIYPLRLKLNDNKSAVFLPDLVEIEVGKIFFVLCHYPIISHHGQAKGSYMLCGHSHGNCDLTNKITGKGRRLDVGVESFGGPISLQKVVDYLKERDYACVDSV